MTETTASQQQLSAAVARCVTMSVPPMLLLMIGAIVQAVRHDAAPRYLLIGAGALASAVAVFAYASLVGMKLKGLVGRGWGPMLITFAALIPYVFGSYLFFYEGLWRLAGLRSGFSLRTILSSILFALVGYWLVSATHRLGETAKFERAVESPAAV